MLNWRSADRDTDCDVAVIGAGFSGTLTAVQLLRVSDGTVSVALIEKRNRFARGVAYAAEDLSHLLNVPAGKMGAYARDPEHFLRWCHEHPESCRAAAVQNVLARSFVPRKLYGDYLEELLDDARRRWQPSLRLFQEEVADLRLKSNGQFIVEFVGGQTINAAKVVLALGNFPPGDPKLRDQRFHTSRRYLTEPWAPATIERLSEPGDILILGSGLTGLDLLLSLAKRPERGVIHLISRRGFFPQPHASCAPWPPFVNESALPKTARKALRQVRQASQRAAEAGSNWRAVIDALRPFTQKIWQQWDWAERRRFLRHLRAYWEPHRHRASPEALAIKENLESLGRLACYRGRVLSIIENAAGLEVGFVEFRRCEPKRLQVSYVVNCTGPECNYHKLKDPLVLQLFLRGLITPDPLFLGVDVGAGGVIYNVYGERVPNLYTLGSPQKGRLLETTAVPELRVQAEDLAKRLWHEIGRVEAGSGKSTLAYEI